MINIFYTFTTFIQICNKYIELTNPKKIIYKKVYIFQYILRSKKVDQANIFQYILRYLSCSCFKNQF